MQKAFLIGMAALLPLLIPEPSAAQSMREKDNVGGYITYGGTTPYSLKPALTPSPLPVMPPREQQNPVNKRVIERANAYLDKYTATTAILLIDNGKILFEAYRGMGRPTSEFFSMSIGKSLTSLALGKAYCNGLLSSLDVKAQSILPELGDSNFGRSTVRQLLMMSSGAYTPRQGGQPTYKGGIGRNPRTGKPFKGHSWPMRLGQASVADILWGKFWQSTQNKNPNQPGEIFMYKSGDILTISKIIERVSGMSSAAYFNQTIWQYIGAARTAHWESDFEGSTLANSSFQATLRDWGRLAIWILAARQKNDCFGAYLKQATSSQIPLTRSASNSFKGYGYQWWTETRLAPGFWGLGYAGQKLAIDPDSGKILLKFSYRKVRNASRDIMRLFKTWQGGNS